MKHWQMIYAQLENSKLNLVAKKRRFCHKWTSEPELNYLTKKWPKKFAHTSVPVDIPLNYLTTLDWGLEIKRTIYTDNLK